MWKVQYTNPKGETVTHGEEFHTRKAARFWCKRAQKLRMTLIGPNGEIEPFVEG